MRVALNSDGWISHWEPNLYFSSALHFLFPKFVHEIVLFKCFGWNRVVWGSEPSCALFEREAAATAPVLIQASFLGVPGKSPLGKDPGWAGQGSGGCSGDAVSAYSHCLWRAGHLYRREMHSPAGGGAGLSSSLGISFQGLLRSSPHISLSQSSSWWSAWWLFMEIHSREEVLRGSAADHSITETQHRHQGLFMNLNQSWTILSSNNAVDWLLFD